LHLAAARALLAAMRSLIGILLNTVGVAALYFGGVPYTTKDTVVQLGPIKAEASMKRKLEIPPEVGAGAVAVGTALLVLSRGRKS
jgi:hypothetical protein